MSTLPQRYRRLAAASVALIALGAIGACASDGDGDASSSSRPDPMATPAVEAEPAGGDADDLSDAADTLDSASPQLNSVASTGRDVKEETPVREAVIRTGTVAMRSPEVATARAQVQEILDAEQGEVSAEKATADTDGELTHVRLVARVPAARFAATMQALEKVGTNLSSRTNAKDVTTEVIDVRARVRAQEKSLARIESLLASAANLDQVIAIEGQLARRQADLDSLKSRLAWLNDRTSLSTITVNLRLEMKEEPPTGDEDQDGFLGGLQDGWDALGTGATAVATGVGAALPFLAVGGLIGVPVWLLVRHGRRSRQSTVEPAEG
ncbi:DUF4349 domain-containing protein [Nocardioides dubius]|uniref:DUF4349 domain-containing protein n=1 Tax=Nocardioides dubius TaxID=317019 RepID=A0ABN1U3B0_9ACTN